MWKNLKTNFCKSQYLFPIWILIFLIYEIWESSRNKLKKHSVTKNCSEILVFDLKNFQPWSFCRSLEQIFLTIGQNNFGNKIPELTLSTASTGMEFLPLFLQFCMFHRQIFQHSLDFPWHQPSKNHLHGRQFCFQQKRSPQD